MTVIHFDPRSIRGVNPAEEPTEFHAAVRYECSNGRCIRASTGTLERDGSRRYAIVVQMNPNHPMRRAIFFRYEPEAGWRVVPVSRACDYAGSPDFAMLKGVFVDGAVDLFADDLRQMACLQALGFRITVGQEDFVRPRLAI